MKRLPPTPASIPRCISNATSPCTSTRGTPCTTPLFTPNTTSQMAGGVPPLGGLSLPPAMSTPDSNNNNNAVSAQSSYFKRYLNAWISSTTSGDGVPPAPINIGNASRTNSVFDGDDCDTPNTTAASMNVSCLSGISAAGGDLSMRRRSSPSVTASTYECRRSIKNYFGRSSTTSVTPTTTPRGGGDDTAGAIASDIMMRWARTPTRRCGTPTRARSMSTSACSTPRAKAMVNFTSPPPPPELLMTEFDHLPFYSSSASAAAPMDTDMDMVHSPTFDRLVQRRRENMCSTDASERQEIQGLLATQSSKRVASRPSTPSATVLHDDPYSMYDATSYTTITAGAQQEAGGSFHLTSSKRSPYSVLSKMEKFARSEYMRKNAARFEQYKAVAGNVSEYTARHIGAPPSTPSTTTTATSDAFLVSGSAPSTPTKLRTVHSIITQTPPNYRDGSRRRSDLEEDENISADTPKTNKRRQQQQMAAYEAGEEESEVVPVVSYTGEQLVVFQDTTAGDVLSSTNVTDTANVKATRTSSLSSAAAISTSLSPRSRSLSQTQPLVEGRVLEGGAPPYPNTNSSVRRPSPQLLRQIQASSSSTPRTQSPARKTMQPQYANLAT